jgi:hypothetical protein
MELCTKMCMYTMSTKIGGVYKIKCYCCVWVLAEKGLTRRGIIHAIIFTSLVYNSHAIKFTVQTGNSAVLSIFTELCNLRQYVN